MAYAVEKNFDLFLLSSNVFLVQENVSSLFEKNILMANELELRGQPCVICVEIQEALCHPTCRSLFVFSLIPQMCHQVGSSRRKKQILGVGLTTLEIREL